MTGDQGMGDDAARTNQKTALGRFSDFFCPSLVDQSMLSRIRMVGEIVSHETVQKLRVPFLHMGEERQGVPDVFVRVSFAIARDQVWSK